MTFDEIDVQRKEIEALREAAWKALRLIEYADVSDDFQYGTLDTTLVRDLLADLRKLLGEELIRNSGWKPADKRRTQT